MLFVVGSRKTTAWAFVLEIVFSDAESMSVTSQQMGGL